MTILQSEVTVGSEVFETNKKALLAQLEEVLKDSSPEIKAKDCLRK